MMAVTKLIKKFPTFYDTQRSYSVHYNSTLDLYSIQVVPAHTAGLHLVETNFNVINLSSLVIPNGSFL